MNTSRFHTILRTTRVSVIPNLWGRCGRSTNFRFRPYHVSTVSQTAEPPCNVVKKKKEKIHPLGLILWIPECLLLCSTFRKYLLCCLTFLAHGAVSLEKFQSKLRLGSLQFCVRQDLKMFFLILISFQALVS